MILVSIGSNLPAADGSPPIETCRKAVAAMAALPGLRLTAISGWWRSAPVPPSGQPPYINGAVKLYGSPDPVELLLQLQVIEAGFGRVRSFINAARILDLDIVAVGGLIRPSPDPVLPHPRAHLRAFVLAPLHEIAPEWMHPTLCRTPGSLLADVVDQICERVSG